MAKEPTAKKLCFVVGPIGPDGGDDRIHADWLLEGIIQPVMTEFSDFEVQRADQMTEPGLIDAQVINALLNAELVIADLSQLNPNAFYEIGIRHMIQKPIIHMQLADQKIPFDLSLYRAIKFARVRPRDLQTAREQLKAQVQSVLSAGYQVENPVTNARGRLKLEQHATPEMRILVDRIESLEASLTSLSRTSLFRGSSGGSYEPFVEPSFKVYRVHAPGFKSNEQLPIMRAIQSRLRPFGGKYTLTASDLEHLTLAFDGAPVTDRDVAAATAVDGVTGISVADEWLPPNFSGP